MNKLVAAITLACALLALPAHAQKTTGSMLDQPILSLSGRESPAPAKEEKKADNKATENKRQGATEITSSKETNFSQKPPVIIFVGDVVVHDPQFDLKADKMTVYLKEQATKTSGTSGDAKTSGTKAAGQAKASGTKAAGDAKTTGTKPDAAASDSSGPSPIGGNQEASNLERVIAEGNVLIVANRPGDKEGETTKYVSRSEKANYEAKTGDLVLTGSPQVQQGVNTHVATDPSTVMYINRNGTFHTVGRAKTVIQEKPDDTNIK